jgi:hypothetical protein
MWLIAISGGAFKHQSYGIAAFSVVLAIFVTVLWQVRSPRHQ